MKETIKLYQDAYSQILHTFSRFSGAIDTLITEEKLPNVSAFRFENSGHLAQMAITFYDLNILIKLEPIEIKFDQVGEVMCKKQISFQRFYIDLNGKIDLLDKPLLDILVAYDTSSLFGNDCGVDYEGSFCKRYIEAILDYYLASHPCLKQKQQG